MRKKILSPEAWGLKANARGELSVNGCSTVDLAHTYGTPLHVVNESRLAATAHDFLSAFKNRYPAKISAHYAFKCNSVPGVVKIIKAAGFKAEVMSEFELNLALRIGFPGNDIIINGPCKPERVHRACLEKNVRFIVIDSLSEIYELHKICEDIKKDAHILLRINPDFIPRGMNQGTATGSRKGCAFGLDLKGGEVPQALDVLKSSNRVHFKGFHFHIGTGIRRPDDYGKALGRLKPLVDHALGRGFAIEVLDIGGGFASLTTREMTTWELLLYQGWERMPLFTQSKDTSVFQNFADAVVDGVRRLFVSGNLPELLIEPGRCITSSNQLLLLTVHRVKERPGVKKWLITDGGIGTVTMPTYYEYHEIFLCNDVFRPRSENVTIIGPVCFAGDVVYRNKHMPEVHAGEVLAVMDSGAYFTAWESSFGFPHPAIIAVANGKHGLIRRRETFTDMTARDQFISKENGPL